MTVANFGTTLTVRPFGWRVSIVAAAVGGVQAIRNWHALVRYAHHILAFAVVVLAAAS